MGFGAGSPTAPGDRGLSLGTGGGLVPSEGLRYTDSRVTGQVAGGQV